MARTTFISLPSSIGIFFSQISHDLPVVTLYALYEAMIYVERDLMPLSAFYVLVSTIFHSRSYIASRAGTSNGLSGLWRETRLCMSS